MWQSLDQITNCLDIGMRCDILYFPLLFIDQTLRMGRGNKKVKNNNALIINKYLECAFFSISKLLVLNGIVMYNTCYTPCLISLIREKRILRWMSLVSGLIFLIRLGAGWQFLGWDDCRVCLSSSEQFSVFNDCSDWITPGVYHPTSLPNILTQHFCQTQDLYHLKVNTNFGSVKDNQTCSWLNS